MNKGVSRKSLAKLKETKLPKKRKSHRHPPIEGAMTVKTKKIITAELVVGANDPKRTCVAAAHEPGQGGLRVGQP
jgi:hypothetical protein